MAKLTCMLLVLMCGCVITPCVARASVSISELALCMAVVDFQIQMYQLFEHMIPERQEPHPSSIPLVRLLSMRHQISTRHIANLDPKDISALATNYIQVRDQVFATFTHAHDATHLQLFVNAIRLMDQNCDHLNTSVHQ